MRPALAAALAGLWLGCGSGGPEAGDACPLLAQRWEGGGHLRVVDCRRLDARPHPASGGWAVELELDLAVLEDTQIFASGELVHRSGPEGRGHRRPAGEVVSLREELVLVETADGWTSLHPEEG